MTFKEVRDLMNSVPENQGYEDAPFCIYSHEDDLYLEVDNFTIGSVTNFFNEEIEDTELKTVVGVVVNNN
jgi:hypothetical protein